MAIQKATCERVDEKQAEILAATSNPAARDTRVMSVREAAKARARAQATESVGLLELHLNGATEVITKTPFACSWPWFVVALATGWPHCKLSARA